MNFRNFSSKFTFFEKIAKVYFNSKNDNKCLLYVKFITFEKIDENETIYFLNFELNEFLRETNYIKLKKNKNRRFE